MSQRQKRSCITADHRQSKVVILLGCSCEKSDIYEHGRIVENKIFRTGKINPFSMSVPEWKENLCIFIFHCREFFLLWSDWKKSFICKVLLNCFSEIHFTFYLAHAYELIHTRDPYIVCVRARSSSPGLHVVLRLVLVVIFFAVATMRALVVAATFLGLFRARWCHRPDMPTPSSQSLNSTQHIAYCTSSPNTFANRSYSEATTSCEIESA